MTMLKPLAPVAGLLFLAVPAHAAMVRAQDPRSLVSALQSGGYQAQLGTDKVGDPMITSAVSGTKFQIYFYNCTDNKDCRTVEFSSGYHLDKPNTIEGMNAFNQTHRFGRAFIDKENDPVLKMDVDLDDGGVPEALFIDNIEFWTSILADFERDIGYRK